MRDLRLNLFLQFDPQSWTLDVRGVRRTPMLAVVLMVGPLGLAVTWLEAAPHEQQRLL